MLGRSMPLEYLKRISNSDLFLSRENYKLHIYLIDDHVDNVWPKIDQFS